MNGLNVFLIFFLTIDFIQARRIFRYPDAKPLPGFTPREWLPLNLEPREEEDVDEHTAFPEHLNRHTPSQMPEDEDSEEHIGSPKHQMPEGDVDEHAAHVAVREVQIGDWITPPKFLPLAMLLMKRVDNPGAGKGIVSSAKRPEALADKLFEGFFQTDRRIIKVKEIDIPGLNALQALSLDGEAYDPDVSLENSWVESPSMPKNSNAYDSDVQSENSRAESPSMPKNSNAYDSDVPSENSWADSPSMPKNSNAYDSDVPSENSWADSPSMPKKSNAYDSDVPSEKSWAESPSMPKNSNGELEYFPSKHLLRCHYKVINMPVKGVRRQGLTALEKKLAKKRHVIVNPGRRTKKENKTGGKKVYKSNKDKAMRSNCHWKYTCLQPSLIQTCQLRLDCSTRNSKSKSGSNGQQDQRSADLQMFRKMLGLTYLDDEVEKILESHATEMHPGLRLRLETLEEYFNNIIRAEVHQKTSPMPPYLSDDEFIKNGSTEKSREEQNQVLLSGPTPMQPR